MTKWNSDKAYNDMRQDILSLAINNPAISLREIERELIRLYGRRLAPTHATINTILNDAGYHKVSGRWEKK